MFQFPALALFRVICLQHTGLSHSEIFGLTIVCIYPKLIAAYHVLHRLLVPRHPPYALIRFKYCLVLAPPILPEGEVTSFPISPLSEGLGEAYHALFLFIVIPLGARQLYSRDEILLSLRLLLH